MKRNSKMTTPLFMPRHQVDLDHRWSASLPSKKFHQKVIKSPSQKSTKSASNSIKILNILYIGLTLTGCFYQITQISITYFSYNTVTEVSIDIMKSIRAPSLSFC